MAAMLRFILDNRQLLQATGRRTCQRNASEPLKPLSWSSARSGESRTSWVGFVRAGQRLAEDRLSADGKRRLGELQRRLRHRSSLQRRRTSSVGHRLAYP